MKKILVYPGWFESLRMYSHNDFVFRSGALEESDFTADCIIGMSLGALIVLKNAKRISGKIILINPPLPRRSILTWIFQWVRFMGHEGLLRDRQRFTRNPIKFFTAALEAVKLLNTDFSEILATFPREKILIIRGRHDQFFCDGKAVEYITSKGINLLEINSGHNWSDLIERTLKGIQ